MIIAWLVLIPTGIFTSAFFRPLAERLLGPKREGGKDKWFYVHVTCNTTGWLLTILGVAFIAADIQGGHKEHFKSPKAHRVVAPSSPWTL